MPEKRMINCNPTSLIHSIALSYRKDVMLGDVEIISELLRVLAQETAAPIVDGVGE